MSATIPIVWALAGFVAGIIFCGVMLLIFAIRHANRWERINERTK